MAKSSKRGRAPAPRPTGAERLEVAMRAINEGVYDWDIAKGTMHYSQGVYSVLRMPRHENTPADWRKRIHPDDLAAYDAALVAHFRKKTRRFECEYRFRASDGSWHWARQRGIALRDPRGRAVRLVGSVGDISALKHAEKARRESDERYAFAMRAINEGVYDWDIAAGTTYYSERVVNVLGLTQKQLRTAADWRKRIHPEDRPRYDAALVAHFKGKTERFECDYRYKARDGSWRWARQHGIAMRDASGRAVRMIGSTGDINELKLSEIELRRARDEATEALERQTATAEILRVIGGSMTDAQPVFDAIVKNCHRLFKDSGVALRLAAGDQLLIRASVGYPMVDALPIDRSSVIGASVVEGRTLHIPDLAAAAKKFPRIRQAGLKYGFHSGIYTPLMRDGKAIGAMSVMRRELGAFDDKDVQLFNTFADQAVIAIENVRLFKELEARNRDVTEALEQQSATAQVLQTISRSAFDLQTVLDTLIQNAARLLGVPAGQILRRHGDELRIAASHSIDADEKAYWDAWKIMVGSPVLVGIVARDKQPLARTYRPDDASMMKATTPEGRGYMQRFGLTSALAVPLLKDDEVIGVLQVGGHVERRFTKREVDLLQTFADQAVIAIENVRLFNETREALERQTATAEILKAIAGSPSDVQPVFDAVAANAARLCGGDYSVVTQFDGQLIHLAAISKELPEMAGAFPAPPSGRGATSRAILERAIIHIPDVKGDREYRPDGLAKQAGIRSIVAVPMLRGDQPLGSIAVSRREPRPFTDHQILLLKTFADQAVIAIENVRLFNETKESLERQTATAEILKVIASSPSDVQPVFDAIAETAKRLLGGYSVSVTRIVDGMVHLAAFTGIGESGDRALAGLFPAPLSDRDEIARVAATKAPFCIEDAETNPHVTTEWREMARRRGFRSVLFVPMLREGVAIGTINVTRREPGAVSGHQVNLLKTFADQAVIAIENVRLFNETKEALERQTASAEILSVISSTPTDTQPVFDAIVESTQRLIPGKATHLLLRGESQFVLAAYCGPEIANLPDRVRAAPLDREKNFPSRAILDREVVHVTDWEGNDVPEFEKLVGKTYGIRSGVLVPLLRKGEGIGVIVVTREIAGPYHEKEIALLQSFADQAVIAIENVRLFNETKEALERQTATAEILKVIASSPSDVQPVFDAIVKSALQLLGGFSAVVHRVVGDMQHIAAFTTTNPAGDAALTSMFPAPIASQTNSGKAILSRAPCYKSDTETDPEISPEGRAMARARGYRSMVAVPMMRESIAIGAISVSRREPGPFTDHQIALLKTFADQAVIAIENVRLFNETKEALERQTATAEILRVIASSPSDVQPVFDAIARSALKLIDGRTANVTLRVGNELHLVALTATSESGDEAFKRMFPTPLTGQGNAGKAILSGRPAYITDVETDPAYSSSFREMTRARGVRSIVAVPMIREGNAIGAISVARANPGQFTNHQTNLLKTFADQAVIAIENVRLFNETKEALERQTATSEVLRVISNSPTDVQPVFDSIAESAATLCGAKIGFVAKFDGGLIHMMAFYGTAPEAVQSVRDAYPMKPEGESVAARVIRSGAPVQIPDVLADAAYTHKEAAASAGFRSALGVPLLRENQIVGALIVVREEVGNFQDKQIELLKTFADQAVIAIENVRLFNETREALEQQTATAEILQVISSSPTDTQPVFEAIVQSGLRLFPDAAVAVVLPEGNTARMVAVATKVPAQAAAWRARFPIPLEPDRLHSSAILECKLIDVPDAETEVNGPYAPGARNFLASGNRAITIAPMLCGDAAIGAISVVRERAGPLSEKQVALLRTFAAQAVIAIENVRTFKELEARTEALSKSVGQLTALGEVGQAISASLDLETVLKTIVSRAVQLTGLDGGTIYEFDEPSGEFRLRASENMPAEVAEVYRRMPIQLGEGVVGSAAAKREPVQVADIQGPDYQTRYRDLLIRQGYRAILAVPLLREDQIIGALTVSRSEPGAFAPEVVELLKTFATQSAMAIQNARLFREIAEKGKQLEEASQHKSQFLASMSHELRTPLNAILGFNEMILGQVYGDVPADMQEPLKDIQTSGKHLLRLINNVLDLAKIEAGRMELSLQDYSVHDTVESVRATLRPLAAEKGLEFHTSVPHDLPLAYGDSGRITQCLMNLAGNSLKFTKAGKVEIAVAAKGELLVYKVADTGIGIAADKIASLFTEFKQTDATIASEYGGTGLGLSISRKFVEMHGGRIWVESEPGKGSAFIFEVPLRAKT